MVTCLYLSTGILVDFFFDVIFNIKIAHYFFCVNKFFFIQLDNARNTSIEIYSGLNVKSLHNEIRFSKKWLKSNSSS